MPGVVGKAWIGDFPESDVFCRPHHGACRMCRVRVVHVPVELSTAEQDSLVPSPGRQAVALTLARMAQSTQLISGLFTR